MDGISALPEHLQLEIFSRVGDVKALFRFAATCRGWLRRFTDRAFLRELSCPGSSHGHGEGSGHLHRARLLGVFVQDRLSSSALAPVFLPALGSPLGPAGRALTSFVGGNDDDDGTFDYAKLLAARRGIVLLRLAPHTPEEMDLRLLFGVCNPVTGDRHVLPPLDWNLTGAAGRRLVGYAIITAADDTNGDGRPPPPAAARFTFSQLLVITQDYDYGNLDRRQRDDALMHWYSAATRCWRAPTKCLDSRVFSLVVGGSSAVVHRGAAHWLCADDGLRRYGDDHHVYRLSVEVATARVSLTRLPIRAGGKRQVLFVNSDDKLAVASVYPVHVTVWTPPADDDTTPAAAAALWPRTGLRVAQPYHHHERWCNFNHGSLLALFRGSSVFVLDLDTKVMEEVFILDFDNKVIYILAESTCAEQYLTCVPYEMDLVEFFTLQLGGIPERLTGTTISKTESS